MHKFYRGALIVVAASLLAGCGSSAGGTTAGSGGSAGSSPTTTATNPTLSAAQAESVSSAVVTTTSPDFAEDQALTLNRALDSVSARSLDPGRANQLAQGLALAAAQLAAGGSRTIASPLGGSAVITVADPSVTVEFQNLVTNSGTVSGSLTVTRTGGNVTSGTYQGTATFTQLKVVTSAGRTLSLDGQGNLARSRSGDPTTTLNLGTTWGANVTASDSQTGQLTLSDFISSSESTLSGQSLTGSQRMDGRFAVSGSSRGIDGSYQITTVSPLQFSGTRAAFSVAAGQLLIAGSSGTVRLTITGPNTVEIAVGPSAGGPFVVVKTTTWQGLGGAVSSL